MYIEPDTLAPASFHDDWARFQTKFRACFRDAKSILQIFATARLESGYTTDSQLCVSVEDAAAAICLESDYKNFLQQLWQKVTGRKVEVVILARHPNDDEVAGAPPKRGRTARRKVGVSKAHPMMMGEEALVPKPPPAGALSPEVSVEIERFVDAELRRCRRFTAALCMVYVAHRYNLKPSMLISRRNLGTLTKIRRVAVYLTRTVTPLPYPQIGKQFGGMTGKFALVACQKVDELRVLDETFDAEVQAHIEYLRAREQAVLGTGPSV
jgi:chromosomal replication initiation ATPase DnaA